MSKVTTIQISDFASIYARGLSDEVLLLDVRTPAEYNEEHLHGAVNIPLNELGNQLDSLVTYNLIYVYCRTGNRSHNAVEHLAQMGVRGVINLGGGIVAWKEQNHTTDVDLNTVISIDRQVKLIAGSGVLISILLAYLFSPVWMGLALFIGSGLTFAGSSGICMLAILLAKMPWNRQQAQCKNPQLKLAGM